MSIEKNGQEPLTTGEIAKHCHVTHRAVLKWVASGKLKAYRTPGKHSRVSIEDFISFLKEYHMPIPESLNPGPTLKKILIVDDDRGIVHSLQRVLVMNNQYGIETAFDGFEAGRKFSTFKPQMIILDLRMPGLDGYQVCADIRKDPANHNVQILAISATNEPADIQKILDLGANAFLQKPFSNEVLQEKVHIMLG